MEESSARVVAVLDPPVMGGPSAEGGSRAPVLWGLLGLIAALAVAVLLLWDHDRSGVVAEPVELDQGQEARVQDLEEGGIIGQVELDAIEALEVEPPSGSIGQGAGFATSETIEVGRPAGTERHTRSRRAGNMAPTVRRRTWSCSR